MKKTVIFILLQFGVSQIIFAQKYTELLGRPTNTSVTVNILVDQNVDVYWEYGLTEGNLNAKSTVYQVTKDTPFAFEMTKLDPNKQYFYRLRYRLSGKTDAYQSGQVHSFHTQRAVGSSFTFAVEADPHMDDKSIPAAYKLTLQNILSHKPDFMIDLGDVTMIDKQPAINQEVITERNIMYRNYYSEVCHSVPLYMVIGNHDGEFGWRTNGKENNMPVMSANTRKLYYPNPEPNAFYSGNNIPEKNVGLLQDYYSWQWGDALFIVLDPYWYTKQKTGWGWTLGNDQYNWLQQILATSKAKYKFVFAHQLVGGTEKDGRGGSEFAHLFEWGGYNQDSTWGFKANRPNWSKPIHNLLVNSKTNIFFHGHDHLYAKQEKDGVIYQDVPQPAASNISRITGTEYGYVKGILLPARGFLLISVSNAGVKVEYVNTYLQNEERTDKKNGSIGDTYWVH